MAQRETDQSAIDEPIAECAMTFTRTFPFYRGGSETIGGIVDGIIHDMSADGDKLRELTIRIPGEV